MNGGLVKKQGEIHEMIRLRNVFQFSFDVEKQSDPLLGRLPRPAGGHLPSLQQVSPVSSFFYSADNQNRIFSSVLPT